MNVDRARFFLLAASMAGVCIAASAMPGCTTETVDVDTKTDSGTVDESDGGTTVDDSDAASTSDASPTACLQDDGVAPDCASFAESDGCLGTAQGQDNCIAAVASLKKGVARDFVDCLGKLELTACTDESGAAVATCLDTATGKACADADVVAPCTEYAAACTAEGGDADAGADGGAESQILTLCKTHTSGLNADGKAALAECLGTDADACIDPRVCTLFSPVTE